MTDPFVLRALFAGLGVAILSGLMGCFVVWRRMAYFGDSMAHSALLGIALGLALGINTTMATLLVCSLFAFLLLWLEKKQILATDTLLGILAHGALAMGVIAFNLLGYKINLHTYLFGDILTLTWEDLVWIYGGGLGIIFFLITYWPSLILMTIHEDLAHAENISVFRLKMIFTFLLTIMVALSIRIVGMILVIALLIIPAATARLWARSPGSMGFFSVCFGILAVIFGLLFSFQSDVPSGPSIIAASVILFLASLFLSSAPAKKIWQNLSRVRPLSGH